MGESEEDIETLRKEMEMKKTKEITGINPIYSKNPYKQNESVHVVLHQSLFKQTAALLLCVNTV